MKFYYVFIFTCIECIHGAFNCSSTVSIIKPTSSIPPSITTTQSTIPPRNTHNIPFTFGNYATVTVFDDTTFQCTNASGNDLPTYSLAVNPLLLGYTANDWLSYKNADSSEIPWCNKILTLTINTFTFTGVIIDTCDPFNCDYDNDIDLYGDNGRKFLKKINDDDFYQGKMTWSIR